MFTVTIKLTFNFRRKPTFTERFPRDFSICFYYKLIPHFRQYSYAAKRRIFSQKFVILHHISPSHTPPMLFITKAAMSKITHFHRGKIAIFKFSQKNSCKKFWTVLTSATGLHFGRLVSPDLQAFYPRLLDLHSCSY